MSDPAPVTSLLAIGGALDLKTPGAPLIEFFQRAGGPQASIVILPTASALPDAGQNVAAALLRLGLVAPARILPVRTRLDAADPDSLAALQAASGVFLTGGNQLRLTTCLGGTPLEAALLQAHQRGVVIAGSSAGAAVMGTVMIAYGKSGPTPRLGMAQFSPGLGFTSLAIFDQHFRQRDRLGRLLSALLLHPGKFGLGVDENTAALLETRPAAGGSAHTVLHIFGQGAVTVLDPRRMYTTDAADLPPGRPAAASNLTLHVLTHGCRLELTGDTPPGVSPTGVSPTGVSPTGVSPAFIPEKTLPID